MAELGGDGEVKYFSEETLREQISLLMRAWGMPEDYIDTTARVMADAGRMRHRHPWYFYAAALF